MAFNVHSFRAVLVFGAVPGSCLGVYLGRVAQSHCSVWSSGQGGFCQ